MCRAIERKDRKTKLNADGNWLSSERRDERKKCLINFTTLTYDYCVYFVLTFCAFIAFCVCLDPDLAASLIFSLTPFLATQYNLQHSTRFLRTSRLLCLPFRHRGLLHQWRAKHLQHLISDKLESQRCCQHVLSAVHFER